MNPSISKYSPESEIRLPVSGGGTNLVIGQIMKRGPTPGTNQGQLVQATGAGPHPDIVGILKQNHTASGNDTDEAGTVFTTRPIDLYPVKRTVSIEYSLAAADDVSIASNSGTSLAVTGLEATINGAFVYVTAGPGIGQTNYITVSSGDTMTLKAAFGTTLTTASSIIKILPYFHLSGRLTSDGLKLATAAAAGSWDIFILKTYIVKNGRKEQLDPTKHATQTGLNSLASLRFVAEIFVQDDAGNPID